MRLYCIIIVYFFILGNSGFPQSGNDSIKRVAFASSVDSVRAKALIAIAYNAYLNQPDSAFIWADSALVIGNKFKMDLVRANACLIKGLVSSVQSKHEEAIKFFNEALPLY